MYKNGTSTQMPDATSLIMYTGIENKSLKIKYERAKQRDITKQRRRTHELLVKKRQDARKKSS